MVYMYTVNRPSGLQQRTVECLLQCTVSTTDDCQPHHGPNSCDCSPVDSDTSLLISLFCPMEQILQKLHMENV